MSNLQTSTPTLLDDLTLPVKKVLSAHSNITRNQLDIKFLKDWWEHPELWKEPMVSFDTFIDDPNYLGVGQSIYPTIRKAAKQILHNGYTEAVLVAGIGSGKTTTAELVACYQAHKLLCLRDAHQYYKLAKDKPITIMNMGTTATQALDVLFAGIKAFIQKSPWFMKFNPHILAGTIRFQPNNILLVSGNSKSTTPLGYNVYCAVMDEAAFYLDNDNKQMAEEIYNALQRRIVSRFGYQGLLMMISSPKYEGDFIMRKLQEAQKMPNIIYAKQLPIWKCKPRMPQDYQTKFYFNSRKNIIEDSPSGKVCSLDDAFNQDIEVWEIPGEYKISFIQDPQKARRDYAALPSATIEAFMPHIDLIKGMFTDEESPVQLNGSYKFPDIPLRVSYYIHIDLALNRKGKGDKAGFAMAHFDGWEVNPTTNEKQKKVVIDIAEQIKAGSSGEIKFEDIRNKVYALKKAGFNIQGVSLDQFQSADTIQIFRNKGIKAEYQSVDRTIEPYQTLKELIYSGRIKCHKSEILFDELRRLEITKASKVDHPPSGSKDVCDAVCGAVYSVMQKSGYDIGVAAVAYNNTPPQPGSREALLEKEQYYKRLHELNDKGLL